jgi:hypothetical protein
VFISTDSFTSQEVALLRSIPLEKYDTHSTQVLNGSGKEQYRIRIAKRSMSDLKSLIDPHIPSMMAYRAGL